MFLRGLINLRAVGFWPSVFGPVFFLAVTSNCVSGNYRSAWKILICTLSQHYDRSFQFGTISNFFPFKAIIIFYNSNHFLGFYSFPGF